MCMYVFTRCLKHHSRIITLCDFGHRLSHFTKQERTITGLGELILEKGPRAEGNKTGLFETSRPTGWV